MSKILNSILENPEVSAIFIKEAIETYKPVVYDVCKEGLKVFQDYANNKEYFETIALSRKNQYDAFIKVGFTEEQAMSLLLTDIRKTAELVEKQASKAVINSKNDK